MAHLLLCSTLVEWVTQQGAIDGDGYQLKHYDVKQINAITLLATNDGDTELSLPWPLQPRNCAAAAIAAVVAARFVRF